MKTSSAFLAAALLAPLGAAQAIELTDLPGVTASANGCYLGCGKPSYDASNVLDGDYGASGNTGLNSWNYGGYAGWVQVDLRSVYAIDRVELYGFYAYYNPFTLSASADGLSWSAIAVSGYHLEPRLTQNVGMQPKYGAVFDVSDASLGKNVTARYLRYTLNGGSPHWGYLFEMDVQGHPVSSVPEPQTYAMLLAGLALLAVGARRKR